ncbi:glycosyltransferase [Microbacterium sp. AK031]|uniref:glycosyltransferase n=1 Tax=Microbacterium sp. AK031 TaxID=2723076 RepID=UPI0021685503|nr:glycosyltransferase [Microbacterium sp. AK031]MCS3841823.1 glycosyltransferase involved in cell wall biosynthesis [Microbacterium sp. AK031]
MDGVALDSVLPGAEYLVLSSRLVPDLDGGYTIATLSRARQLAAAGVADGAGPLLLTFDPADAASHAAQRATFARRGAIADPARMRNLFDEAVGAAGGAAAWLRDTASADLTMRAPDREYRVLRDAEDRPFVALPVIPGDPDWHLTEEPVLIYDETARVIGGVAGFRGLYNAWLHEVTAAFGHTPIVVICESRQLGELIADWDDPRVRIIHTIHTMHLEPPYTPDAAMNALWTRWFALADRFDAVAWPTRTQRDDVARRFGERIRNVVIPNAAPVPGARSVEREPGLVVVLGRLAPGKRVDHSIRAFLAADVTGSRMEIWGGGAEHDALQMLIDELGAGSRVMLAGHTDAPGRVLDRASVVVTSTAFEGQGLSILEALLHDVPVVAYDVRYGPGDLLGAGGGILVPDGDEAALAEAVRAVLTDRELYDRLVAEAPVAASAWSAERATEAFAATVREVLAAPPRR